jgi:hypothetical protein
MIGFAYIYCGKLFDLRLAIIVLVVNMKSKFHNLLVGVPLLNVYYSKIFACRLPHYPVSSGLPVQYF